VSNRTRANSVGASAFAISTSERALLGLATVADQRCLAAQRGVSTGSSASADASATSARSLEQAQVEDHAESPTRSGLPLSGTTNRLNHAEPAHAKPPPAERAETPAAVRPRPGWGRALAREVRSDVVSGTRAGRSSGGRGQHSRDVDHIDDRDDGERGRVDRHHRRSAPSDDAVRAPTAACDPCAIASATARCGHRFACNADSVARMIDTRSARSRPRRGTARAATRRSYPDCRPSSVISHRARRAARDDEHVGSRSRSRCRVTGTRIAGWSYAAPCLARDGRDHLEALQRDEREAHRGDHTRRRRREERIEIARTCRRSAAAPR
jgi:hypothetical protein